MRRGGIGSREATTGLAVAVEGALHDVGGKRRSGRLAIPIFETGEVIADELLVEAGRIATGLPLIGRPKATTVGGEKLIDEEEITFLIGAELEFGVGQN